MITRAGKVFGRIFPHHASDIAYLAPSHSDRSLDGGRSRHGYVHRTTALGSGRCIASGRSIPPRGTVSTLHLGTSTGFSCLFRFLQQVTPSIIILRSLFVGIPGWSPTSSQRRGASFALAIHATSIQSRFPSTWSIMYRGINFGGFGFRKGIKRFGTSTSAAPSRSEG